MTQDVITQLSNIFAPVAQKIGEGAQYGWEVVMRQQYVIAVENIIGAILSLLFLVAVGLFVKYALKRQESWSDDWGFAARIVGIFGGLAGIVAFLICTFTAISYFINPAYYALQFFISLGGGK